MDLGDQIYRMGGTYIFCVIVMYAVHTHVEANQ